MVTNRYRKSFGSRRKNSKSAQTSGTVDVFDPLSGISGPIPGEFPHVQIFMNDGPNPLKWDAQFPAIDLVKIRRSSKISSWAWSIICEVVPVLGRPERGTSQVEKSPRLNGATKVLMMAYYGAYFPDISLRMLWISLGALPCRKKKLDDSSRLDVVEIARRLTCFLPASVTRKYLQFGTWTDPLSNDAIDSVLRHRELVRAIVPEVGWASGPVWTGAEISTPPGFDLRTVQPVGSRYTDYATRPTPMDFIVWDFISMISCIKPIRNKWWENYGHAHVPMKGIQVEIRHKELRCPSKKQQS